MDKNYPAEIMLLLILLAMDTISVDVYELHDITDIPVDRITVYFRGIPAMDLCDTLKHDFPVLTCRLHTDPDKNTSVAQIVFILEDMFRDISIDANYVTFRVHLPVINPETDAVAAAVVVTDGVSTRPPMMTSAISDLMIFISPPLAPGPLRYRPAPERPATWFTLPSRERPTAAEVAFRERCYATMFMATIPPCTSACERPPTIQPSTQYAPGGTAFPLSST